MLEEKVKHLESIVKDTLEIPKKYHRNLIERRAQFLTDLKSNLGVDVKVPKDDNETLTLEGPDVIFRHMYYIS